MSKTPKTIGDNDAIEITEYLLSKGISQTKIGGIVNKSQPWVSGIKNNMENFESGKEAGRQEVQREIISNIEDRAAREITARVLQSPLVTIESND